MQGQPLVRGAEGEWQLRGDRGWAERKRSRNSESQEVSRKVRGPDRAAAGGLGQFPGVQFLPLQRKFAIFAGGS